METTEVIERIFKAHMKLNELLKSMSDEIEKAKQACDEAEKVLRGKI